MDPNFPSDLANAGSGVRIPGGRRRALLVAAVAVVAGVGAVVAVLLTQGGGDGTAKQAPRPLAGSPPLFLQLPGPAVTGGADAVYAAARQRLAPGDPRIAVARVIAGYTKADRARAIAALHKLPQSNPAVVFELGLAQLWAGDPSSAARTLERVKRLNPYGYYGTNADNVLNLSEVRGYPPYFPPSNPTRSVRALQAAVARTPGSAALWLQLAVRLERSDRLEAIAAARKAAALDPTGVSEQVAVTVLGFDKDRPMDAIQALGTLVSQGPLQKNAEVRFHLGLLYFWLKDGQDAAGQFTQVEQDAPKSPYAQVAHVFDECIDSPAACRRIASQG
jgi:tetratricopeptide (TPR) repeat protein